MAHARLWWDVFGERLFIAFDSNPNQKPELSWDIELDLLGCCGVPDALEDRVATALLTLLMLTFNEVNPLEIDLKSALQQEEQAAAAAIQATFRGKSFRKTRQQAKPSTKQEKLEAVSRKVDEMMSVLEGLQKELRELKAAA